MCLLATLAVGGPDCGEEVYKYGFSEDQRAEIIASHNAVRTQYGASPLKWDSALAMGARKVTESCTMKHRVQVDSRYPVRFLFSFCNLQNMSTAVDYEKENNVFCFCHNLSTLVIIIS